MLSLQRSGLRLDGGSQIIILVLAMMMVSETVAVAVPLLLGRVGRQSSLAGSVTSTLNIGGGLVGILLGRFLDASGWTVVF